MAINIRLAVKEDIPELLRLIKELAVFERAPNEVSNTEARMLREGFGNSPVFDAFVAEHQGEIIGTAITYFRYSTWKGKCLYLEDLIVTERHRGIGAGKALFEHCLNYAKATDSVRMSWQVLDWNTPAIDFYKKYGTRFEEGWLNSWVDV
jgi:GNAT superfamily N-acetyltransferase